MSSSNSAAMAAEEAAEALARTINVTYTKYYAASMAGLIVIFTIVNWVQLASRRYSSNSSGLNKGMTSVSKPIRRLLLGTQIGNILVLWGQLILATTYWSINVALMFTNMNWSDQTFFARRCGWLALCNLCLVMFLALKHTPLSPLVGLSYQSINVLHRCCGYTTILLMILHSSNFIAGLAKAHALAYFMDLTLQAASAAGLFLLIIGVTASRFFRRGHYEMFFVLHVVLVIAVLIMVLLHVMIINWAAIIIVIVTASMWFVDRSLRLSRWIYHGFGNYCTITPLPEGATRVVMQRSIRAQPGSHAFLWIPSIRAFQTHPFTLVSNNPAEFVISARDGFTRELHEFALQNPNAVRRAAIEGPYGNIPETNDFDKVVLVSGGSGITCTLALAMDWLKRQKQDNHKKTLDFTWTVKTKDELRWFEQELNELHASPSVNLKLHVTCSANKKSGSSSPALSTFDSNEQEKQLYKHGNRLDSLEKCPWSQFVQTGRPNIDDVLSGALDGLPQTERVLIACAGPTRLLDNVRLTTSGLMTSQSPNIQLHLEEFDW